MLLPVGLADALPTCGLAYNRLETCGYCAQNPVDHPLILTLQCATRVRGSNDHTLVAAKTAAFKLSWTLVDHCGAPQRATPKPKQFSPWVVQPVNCFVPTHTLPPHLPLFLQCHRFHPANKLQILVPSNYKSVRRYLPSKDQLEKKSIFQCSLNFQALSAGWLAGLPPRTPLPSDWY